MSPLKRYAKKPAKARQRRRQQAHARLECDQRQAQRAAEALHRAFAEASAGDWAFQGPSEAADCGHLVLRLMGSFGLFYTSCVICQVRLTMEAIIFSLKYYWRFVDLDALRLPALS
jgi:hypothetical protein